MGHMLYDMMKPGLVWFSYAKLPSPLCQCWLCYRTFGGKCNRFGGSARPSR